MMSIRTVALERTNIPVEGLPQPHRCPWWIHYLLASPLRRWAEPPAKFLGPYVKPSMTVLDLGCGFGYASVPLAEMVGPNGRVISVDVEPRVLDKLKRRARRAGVEDRIDTRACEATELSLPEYDGEVDLVTVIHTLHELHDLPGFLEHVKKLLKPDGRLFVIEPNGHVTAEGFAAELECCRLAGFEEMERPPLGRKHLIALMTPATE